MNLNGFMNHLLNIAYDMIILLLSVVAIIIFLWIFVKIKRWYGKARINRSSTDFKTAVDYIDENDKSINRFQRLYLNLTGEIESIANLKFIIFLFLIVAIISILFGLLLWYDIIEYEIIEKILDAKLFTIVLIICCTALEIFIVSLWVEAIKGLIRFARILPFLFWSILLTVYAFILFQNIKLLIT